MKYTLLFLALCLTFYSTEVRGQDHSDSSLNNVNYFTLDNGVISLNEHIENVDAWISLLGDKKTFVKKISQGHKDTIYIYIDRIVQMEPGLYKFKILSHTRKSFHTNPNNYCFYKITVNINSTTNRKEILGIDLIECKM